LKLEAEGQRRNRMGALWRRSLTAEVIENAASLVRDRLRNDAFPHLLRHYLSYEIPLDVT